MEYLVIWTQPTLSMDKYLHHECEIPGNEYIVVTNVKRLSLSSPEETSNLIGEFLSYIATDLRMIDPESGADNSDWNVNRLEGYIKLFEHFHIVTKEKNDWVEVFNGTNFNSLVRRRVRMKKNSTSHQEPEVGKITSADEKEIKVVFANQTELVFPTTMVCIFLLLILYNHI